MIRVISAGIYTTVQDLGRQGYGHLGVPISGVMDNYSAKLANHLLGNNENKSVLEITLGNTTLLFENNLFIVISGADLQPLINDSKVSINRVLEVNAGDVLKLGKPMFGVRTYVAVKGGFQIKEVLGSKSWFKNVTEQFLVKKGDILPVLPQKSFKMLKNASVRVNKEHFITKFIEVYKGPEYDLLTEKQRNELKNTVFTISKDNNRMGYRLVETVENELGSMLTSSVLPGTVQLTPSGTLIVLMRDCQVTGGYPRVLQLAENAIDRLSQKSTNDTFQFKLVDLNL
ncbi:MAG: biotin-dependent carboxyltransferase family protein [Flavobacteriaceae bacterium]